MTEKVGALTESQVESDERYSKVRRENDHLRTK